MATATQLQAVEPVKDVNDFPRGTVVVPTHDLARYHQFTYDLTLLDVPDGTQISFQRSASIVQNLNHAVEAFLEDTESAWCFFLGDDHTFNRDLCLRMLRHEVDIVAPLCVMRGPPFSLVQFNEQRGEDDLGRPLYRKMGFDELPAEDGLFEVTASGCAGMLVKRRVFEALERPWFRNSDNITVNEDMVFCRRVRELGFKILIDPASRIGHMGMVAAWPDRRDGVWGLTLDFQGAGHNQIFVPGGVKLDEPTAEKGTLEW